MIDVKDCWLKDRCKASCGDFCIKLFKLDYLYNQALLTIPQRKHLDIYTYEDEKEDKLIFKQLKEVQDNIEDFIAEGNNIYLHSTNAGVGKTSIALRLIQVYFEAIWHKCDLKCKALFINVPRFLIALKDNISHESEYVQHIKENVLEADLVVWDEIATKSLTVYEHENLLQLINARIDAGKSNIYTSNMNADELKEKLGDRLYSRIVNYSYEFEFYGRDKRMLKFNGTTSSNK